MIIDTKRYFARVSLRNRHQYKVLNSFGGENRVTVTIDQITFEINLPVVDILRKVQSYSSQSVTGCACSRLEALANEGRIAFGQIVLAPVLAPEVGIAWHVTRAF